MCLILLHGIFQANHGIARRSNWIDPFSCYLLKQWEVVQSTTEAAVGNLLAVHVSVSLCLSLSFVGGGVPSAEELDDWQLHMCLCNYGKANWQRGTLGHCHYWHTRTAPRTCRWRWRWPFSQREAWSKGRRLFLWGCPCVCVENGLQGMEVRL